MPRPRINGTGRQPRKYCRIAVAYIHKKEVLDYIGAGNSLDETINHFYGELDHKQRRAKNQKQINKWIAQEHRIRDACSSGGGTHRNLRHRGEATVLPKSIEEGIVRWINALR
ncbi:hypothetical protein L914_17631 [Phytophthora nicotianae]|uniref:HTH CENPB-type domain-containing protein n=1 Tax=Phytophthora nicotianae TaxID=4792 RepID=W2MIH5_PHYNI|nr:hypothetical protein L914_17631 [Phytophthora nicotianae]